MSIKSLVWAYNELNKLDLRVLRVIEIGHRKFEYVPLELIIKWVGKDEEKISRSLRKLNGLGMIQRYKGSYIGYRLTYHGYDALALHTLVKRGIISKLSPTPLGVGKESDVYVGDSELGIKIVIKFHRLGRTSFRNTRKFRVWVGDRRHITWLYESRLSAHMEYKALTLAYNVNVKVPKPITVNRHAVVMEYIDNSLQLSEVKLEEPEKVLEDIIEQVRKTYKEASIVHGDLSKFNVLVNLDNGDIRIIDWSQFVPRGYRNALELLKRDLQNIIDFFNEYYDVETNLDEVVDYVTEGVEIEELSIEEAFERIMTDYELKKAILGEESIEKELERIDKEFE